MCGGGGWLLIKGGGGCDGGGVGWGGVDLGVFCASAFTVAVGGEDVEWGTNEPRAGDDDDKETLYYVRGETDPKNKTKITAT